MYVCVCVCVCVARKEYRIIDSTFWRTTLPKESYQVSYEKAYETSGVRQPKSLQ
jgi:hypothetical protein